VAKDLRKYDLQLCHYARLGFGVFIRSRIDWIMWKKIVNKGKDESGNQQGQKQLVKLIKKHASRHAFKTHSQSAFWKMVMTFEQFKSF